MVTNAVTTIDKLMRGSLIASAAMLFASGCTERTTEPAPIDAAPSSESKPEVIADQWLGQWNGPEGTFLRINGGGGKYELIIQNLDGPQTYEGFPAGNGIEFERDGAKEFIRATNGLETGMKWLTEKSNCLTVRLGEGYCRD